MPSNIYASLNLGPLKETNIIVQLFGKTNICQKGIIQDVLVQVDEMIFPVGFYILDMSDDSCAMSTPLLVGRTFMKIVHTKIDVHNRELTLEFGENIIRFNIFEAMKYLVDDEDDFR